MTAAGRRRSYVLVTPRTFDARERYPVVLAFHGDGATGDSLRGYFRVASFTGEDALVVYPDAAGAGRAWDLETRASKPNADVDFVRALVAELVASRSADATHVFATGWSNGGFFVSTLACRAPSLVRAIASHAGGAPYDVDDKPPLAFSNGYVRCIEGQTGVPAFVVHGAVDRTVTPDSGDFNALYWAFVNGCDVQAAKTPRPGRPECGAYSCPAGHDVTYCRPAALGHGIWEHGARESWDWFARLR